MYREDEQGPKTREEIEVRRQIITKVNFITFDDDMLVMLLLSECCTIAGFWRRLRLANNFH